MAAADVVITGTVLTVDEKRPTAQALAVADGRIIAVDDRSDVARFVGPGSAQTIDAAWQLFADDVIGSLEVGKYAGMVVLSAEPRTVPPEQIADLDVRAAFLAGRQVYRQ
jgi:predicted amidohydrolase YtcJ